MENRHLRLAIFDDHQIVIDGLKLLLENNADLRIVAEATAADEMLKQLSVKGVDILLTDIAVPTGMNGYELSRTVKAQLPGIRILALSMNEDGGMIARMIEDARVDGYIPKAAGQRELLAAIEKIASGDRYFSASILEQYETYQLIRDENQAFNLSARELEIIRCIVMHYSNKQIADKLFISERTVETHRKNIYRKTGTKGEASLIQFVTEHRILS